LTDSYILCLAQRYLRRIRESNTKVQKGLKMGSWWSNLCTEGFGFYVPRFTFPFLAFGLDQNALSVSKSNSYQKLGYAVYQRCCL